MAAHAAAEVGEFLHNLDNYLGHFQDRAALSHMWLIPFQFNEVANGMGYSADWIERQLAHADVYQ